uniref:DUF834 domain-containing protein n=1 Tax=Oryza brachyantha TaxID=4533 RepID=J3ME18_ORYBR
MADEVGRTGHWPKGQEADSGPREGREREHDRANPRGSGTKQGRGADGSASAGGKEGEGDRAVVVGGVTTGGSAQPVKAATTAQAGERSRATQRPTGRRRHRAVADGDDT